MGMTWEEKTQQYEYLATGAYSFGVAFFFVFLTRGVAFFWFQQLRFQSQTIRSMLRRG
jgi:hypothetical protein